MVTDSEIQELIAMGEKEAGTAATFKYFDGAFAQYVSVLQTTAVQVVPASSSRSR